MLQLIQLLRRLKPDTDWMWHETTSGPVMRRRVDSKYQTRPMTLDEQDAYMATRIGW